MLKSTITSDTTSFISSAYKQKIKTTTFYIGNLNSLDTSKVTHMLQMFYYTRYSANYNLNLSSWDVSLVTSKTGFNTGASWITPPIWVN